MNFDDIRYTGSYVIYVSICKCPWPRTNMVKILSHTASRQSTLSCKGPIVLNIWLTFQIGELDRPIWVQDKFSIRLHAHSEAHEIGYISSTIKQMENACEIFCCKYQRKFLRCRPKDFREIKCKAVYRNRLDQETHLQWLP